MIPCIRRFPSTVPAAALALLLSGLAGCQKCIEDAEFRRLDGVFRTEMTSFLDTPHGAYADSKNDYERFHKHIDAMEDSQDAIAQKEDVQATLRGIRIAVDRIENRHRRNNELKVADAAGHRAQILRQLAVVEGKFCK